MVSHSRLITALHHCLYRVSPANSRDTAQHFRTRTGFRVALKINLEVSVKKTCEDFNYKDTISWRLCTTLLFLKAAIDFSIDMKEHVNTKELYDYRKKRTKQNCWRIWKLCTVNVKILNICNLQKSGEKRPRTPVVCLFKSWGSL